MKLNCLACGHRVELDDAYDDFEGQVKCLCGILLEIRTDEGKLKSIRLAETLSRPASPPKRLGAQAPG